MRACLEYPEATLAPSFLDVHTHGAAGHDVMEATPEALDAIGSFLAAHGTAAIWPPRSPLPWMRTLRALAGLAKLLGNRRSEARRGHWAFIWKGRFSLMSNAALIRRSICSRPTLPSSIGSSRLRRATCG